MKTHLTILAVLASLAISSSAVGRPPQVIPEPMLVNLFALTEASSTLRICANSSAYPTLPRDKKNLLRRLQGRIDGLVKSMAAKFDDDLFSFFETQRDKAARDPSLIEQVRSKYGPCDDALFKRMQWYVYDSRQKLEHFLSELPDAK